MENTTSKQKHMNVEKDFDYSKAEETQKNIVIPNSNFQAKWKKEEGYTIGIENIKLTKNYKTLEEALNQIGYGVEKDTEGDEILVKVGETDYEMIVRITRALIILNNENNG
ncbi:MAG: hypothetical protein [Wigfec virus K19_83]|nr:MAG: hypothetical protein [Wigfec virus K19_83]